MERLKLIREPYSGKLSRIGKKYDFRRENFRGLLAFTMPKDTTPLNFTEKTFMNSHKIAKFAKVFSLKSFPLYGMYNISGARTKGSYGRWKDRENGELLATPSAHPQFHTSLHCPVLGPLLGDSCPQASAWRDCCSWPWAGGVHWCWEGYPPRHWLHSSGGKIQCCKGIKRMTCAPFVTLVDILSLDTVWVLIVYITYASPFHPTMMLQCFECTFAKFVNV